jgi:hypothetical protein
MTLAARRHNVLQGVSAAGADGAEAVVGVGGEPPSAQLAQAAVAGPVQDGLVADADGVALADRQAVEAVGIEPRPGGVPDGTDAGLVGQPRSTPEESATLHSPLDELRLEVNQAEPAPGFVFHWVAKAIVPPLGTPLLLVREWSGAPTIGPSLIRVEYSYLKSDVIANNLRHYYPDTPPPALTEAVELLKMLMRFLPCGSK